MYDLNLSVPDFTSKKYSNDNRFLLLKNYLYELNEALSFALDNKRNDEIVSLAEKVGSVEKTQNDVAYTLQSKSVSKFRQLKEDILRMSGSGILVTGFNGGNCNPATGDFSFGVEGFAFSRGKVTHPVREMLITGNIMELWNNLKAVGSDARPSVRWQIGSLAFDDVSFSA